MPDIKELLNQEGIKVIRVSDVGEKINSFDKWSSERLFTFLINNQLNRYLFNVFIRMGTPDIENWPFNVELLSPSRIQEKAKESFIKKFTCSSCNQILYNESYVDMIKFDEIKEIECPKCKIKLELKYESLIDSFDISKRILAEYLEQLSTRHITEAKLIKHCLLCRNKKRLESDMKFTENFLKCDKCQGFFNLAREHSFKDKFLSECISRRGGDWFEWYVYTLCKYMHEEVEHNLIVEIGDIKKEIELDVVGRDGDKLTIYECKDTEKMSDWKDFEKIPDLIENFENVTIVNSYDSNRKALRKLLELIKREITIVKGSDLEDNFIGTGPTILRLKSREWPYGKNGIESFKQLSKDKKREIVYILLTDILRDKDVNQNLYAILKILEDYYDFKEIFIKKDKEICYDIIKKFLIKIQEKRIIKDSDETGYIIESFE